MRFLHRQVFYLGLHWTLLIARMKAGSGNRQYGDADVQVIGKWF